MGNEPAGVIESGVKKGLHAAAIYPPDPGTEQHVGLPDLIAVFGFKLLVRRWCEQLFFRQTALFEETVECGSRERGRVLTGRQGQFAQQSRAGAMRVLTLETFDEAGQLRSDGAGLSAVLARLGCQCLETTVAVAQRPIEQRIDGNRRSFRMGDVVGAGSDLLGAAREFAAGKTFNYQLRDQPEAKQSQFFGFGIHAKNLQAPDDNQERRSSAMQMLCREPQGAGHAEASVVRRPVGMRHAGQPSRWTRSCENRKRCAAIHPMDSSIRRVLETKSAAGSRGCPGASGTRARLRAGACF